MGVCFGIMVHEKLKRRRYNNLEVEELSCV